MSRRYNNFVVKLQASECKMLTPETDFQSTKRLSFECCRGHVSSMSAASFINKTSKKAEEALRSLCAECQDDILIREEIDDVLARLGFSLLNYQKDDKGNRVVAYRCVCGNESRTDFRNLKKADRKPQCVKCQNDPHKVDFTTIRAEFAARGCELMTPQEDYKNNKMRLSFRCVCGSVSEIVYHDLRRGRLCGSCKTDRVRETCLEKYSVHNPSKDPAVLQKIVATNRERRGVSYPQQKPEIREETDRTSMERYGVKRAFCLPEVFEKIRKTHIQKHGVEFPLQSKEIQDKISLTFQQTLGASRPFLSQTFLERMKEKYGHEWFACTDRFREIIMERYGSEYYVNSDHCKKEMMERYGSEYYVNSDHYKRKMLEKYGVEYPMQNEDLFRKAQKSSFARRPYVSWDGRVFMVLGYEDAALDGIFREEGCKIVYAGEDPQIPCFQYLGDDNKYHKYYPDFFIPGENRVIEVKSVYTYNRDPVSTLNKALVVSETHLFELRLYDHKKQLVEVLECRNGFFYSHTSGHLCIGETYHKNKDTAGNGSETNETDTYVYRSKEMIFI